MTICEEESSPLTLAAGTVTLDFLVSRTEGNTCVLRSPQVRVFCYSSLRRLRHWLFSWKLSW